jgi:hypothetical protein
VNWDFFFAIPKIRKASKGRYPQHRVTPYELSENII